MFSIFSWVGLVGEANEPCN